MHLNSRRYRIWVDKNIDFIFDGNERGTDFFSIFQGLLLFYPEGVIGRDHPAFLLFAGDVDEGLAGNDPVPPAFVPDGLGQFVNGDFLNHTEFLILCYGGL